ncbi:hypothetical protein [Myxosarcina sp. GI1(2024)]
MTKPDNQSDRSAAKSKPDAQIEAVKKLANEPATESPETWERGVDLVEDKKTANERASQQKPEEE